MVQQGKEGRRDLSFGGFIGEGEGIDSLSEGAIVADAGKVGGFQCWQEQ
jgi:hypothetical protein